MKTGVYSLFKGRKAEMVMNRNLNRGLLLLSVVLVFALFLTADSGGAVDLSSERFLRDFRAPSVDNAEPQPAIAGSYATDPIHSTIGFAARHRGIADLPGRFREYGGIIQYDPAHVKGSWCTVTRKA